MKWLLTCPPQGFNMSIKLCFNRHIVESTQQPVKKNGCWCWSVALCQDLFSPFFARMPNYCICDCKTAIPNAKLRTYLYMLAQQVYRWVQPKKRSGRTEHRKCYRFTFGWICPEYMWAALDVGTALTFMVGFTYILYNAQSQKQKERCHLGPVGNAMHVLWFGQVPY